jgi:hypothetical protein
VNQRRGLIYALIGAALAGFVAARNYLGLPLGTPGPDFDQAWFAARALLQGRDPYAVVDAAHGFQFPLYYPLTTAIVAMPFTPFSLDVARFFFVAGSAGVFGYAIGCERAYLWPTFLGLPFLTAIRSTQWSPLLTAAMLIPALGWLAAAKPNLGFAMLAGARSWRVARILVIGGTVVLLVSLAVDPMWPWRWREALQHSTHFRPLILRPCGVLMLLALLRWRDPDARLLLALAIVPVTGLFYDVLPACVVARTRAQAAALALATLFARAVEPFLPPMRDFAQEAWINGTFVLLCGLIPPLVLVLMRSERLVAWRAGRKPAV